MMKLLMGFAVGYWVGARRASGQDLVPADVRSLAAKYASEVQIMDAGAEGDKDETVPSVVSSEKLSGFSGFGGYRRRSYRR